MDRRGRLGFAAGAAALALLLGTGAAAQEAGAARPALPPEGRCPDWASLAGARGQGDSGGAVFHEGDALSLDQLLRLSALLPPEIWNNREVFFYEGMRLEIGWCHRRYPTARFYAEATRAFAGRPHLDDEGNLLDYVAGLPFPPETIDPDAPDAGTRWAWDFEERYRGAGPVGRFRLLDLPSGRLTWHTTAQTYVGSFFQLRTGNRSDLAASDYRVPESTKTSWVAGGRFEEPEDARHLAWRQIRSRKTDRDWKRPDETFVYVPELRKARRAASAWVDGVYMPRYRVTGQNDIGSIPFNQGGSEFAPNISSIDVNAGKAIAATEDIRRGFTGLAIRPNAYRWKVLGYREVLAPLNASAVGWPTEPDRNYGPSGLSVGSDRWDVRYAVVLRGVARREVEGVAAVTLWLDWQTQQPLYFMTHRKQGFLLDIGILVHRFSGDTASYPAWPSGEPARVFDPVAAVFYFVPDGGGGWRRESYDVRSVPLEPGELRRLTTTDQLLKGR